MRRVGPEGTDLQKPIPSRARDMSHVGRAFMVRQPSDREATFSRGGGATKMSDLKAPTCEYRSPVGRAFTVRRPSFLEATFSRGGGVPNVSDLKAPTYEYRDASRRSGLYGPTAIFLRSDIFKKGCCAKDVGPEGAELQNPGCMLFAEDFKGAQH